MKLLDRFNDLVNTMQKYDIYQHDDEVGLALDSLLLEIQATDEYQAHKRTEEAEVLFDEDDIPYIKDITFLDIEIDFYCPIERNDYYLGSVHLECEGRKFVLDVAKSHTNENNTKIICQLEIDAETFPIEEYLYNLTTEDMLSNQLKGTLFVSGDGEVDPDSITLFIKYGNMTKAIDLNEE